MDSGVHKFHASFCAYGSVHKSDPWPLSKNILYCSTSDMDQTWIWNKLYLLIVTKTEKYSLLKVND